MTRERLMISFHQGNGLWFSGSKLHISQACHQLSNGKSCMRIQSTQLSFSSGTAIVLCVLILSLKFQWIMIIYDFYQWIWKSVHVSVFAARWGCPKRLHVSTWIIKWNSPCILLSAEYLCYQDSDSNWVIQEISCTD